MTTKHTPPEQDSQQPQSVHLAAPCEQERARFTPGPWRFGDLERHEGRAYQRICDTWGDGLSSNIVARVCVSHAANHELNADGAANARLIAASPDLYAVARKLRDARNKASDVLAFCEMVDDFIEEVDAAIAKVETK